MNVIRLSDLEEEDDPNYSDFRWTCAITDELGKLVPKQGDNFVMYFVWQEDMEFDIPFGVFQLRNGEFIQNVSSSEAEETMVPMWNPEHPDRPSITKKKGDVLKLSFWRFGDEINYSWIDITPKNGEMSRRSDRSMVRSIGRTDNFNYIIMPSIKKSVVVLSENLYCYYLATGIKQRYLVCGIVMEEGTAFEHLSCGHSVCCRCWFRRNADMKECMFCRNENITTRVMKVRPGPCPVDFCTEDGKSGDETGIVLNPCGCFIPCKTLSFQIRNEADQQKIRDTLNVCPYDACKSPISEVFRYFSN